MGGLILTTLNNEQITTNTNKILLVLGEATPDSTIAVKLRERNNRAVEWIYDNPILNKGEIGVDDSYNLLKIGNGHTPWKDLQYTTGKGASISGEDNDLPLYSLDKQLRGKFVCARHEATAADNIYMYLNVTCNGVTNCVRVPLAFFSRVKNQVVKEYEGISS